MSKKIYHIIFQSWIWNYWFLFRCETFYRVLYTICIQWRNYLMLCGNQCYHLFNKDLDCAVMVATIMATATTSVMFSASAIAIRPIYFQLQKRLYNHQCPSVSLSAKPLNSLKSSSFIIQPSSFFIHPSFILHHSSFILPSFRDF